MGRGITTMSLQRVDALLFTERRGPGGASALPCLSPDYYCTSVLSLNPSHSQEEASGFRPYLLAVFPIKIICVIIMKYLNRAIKYHYR